ncbi:hypothetical protein [Candidatus Thiothrix anitrata]|jgi:hypothetical protein|uniref:Uncharacterized protein n=1 Tax=Candidatus Thiothrix anitrata TaxID=2823902 RepID=A0ABX7X4P5_9GAMM|nr:hypothetical protein [Candidatus Thiothrix anitrata]QTR50861.1 hypothetical protein J8380_04645 [Candidatus Thiothrix anitrata]
MKYFPQILMALLILSGVTLVLTPFVAEWLLPASSHGFRQAKSDEVKQALASWFGTKTEAFGESYGVNQDSAQGTTAWFAFSVAREPVTNFILRNRLQQQELTPEHLQRLFLMQPPPVAWWQPATLQRETYFAGTEAGRQLSLIYHAEQQRGFLVVRTQQKINDF